MKRPIFCQPRIIVTSAVTELWPELLGIQTHGTKLVYIKWTTEPADTLLLEDGTSSILHVNDNVANQE